MGYAYEIDTVRAVSSALGGVLLQSLMETLIKKVRRPETKSRHGDLALGLALD